MTVITHPNGIAPTESGNYRLGAKGGRMAKAWQYIWDQFDGSNFKDGMQLANDAAAMFDLKPISVSGMLCRMAAAGALEQEMIPAATHYLRAEMRTEYVAGDFGGAVELTKRERKAGLEEIVDRVLPIASVIVRKGPADKWDLVAQLVRDTGLDQAQIVKTLSAMVRAGVIRIQRAKRDRPFTANRKRVHYRINHRD